MPAALPKNDLSFGHWRFRLRIRSLLLTNFCGLVPLICPIIISRKGIRYALYFTPLHRAPFFSPRGVL